MKKKIKLLVLPAVLNMQHVIDRFPFDIELTKGKFTKLEIIFKDGEVTILYDGVDLRDFSFVWLSSSWRSRDLAYALKLYLDKNGIPNTYIEKGTSKLTDHMTFSLSEIASPNTFFLATKKIEGYPLAHFL